MPGWRNGRRNRLKICCLFRRAGSSPAPGTIFFVLKKGMLVKIIVLVYPLYPSDDF